MRCPEGLVLSITALAVAISDKLSPDEAALLAAAATQFGDTLATLAAARECGAAAQPGIGDSAGQAKNLI